MLFEDDFIIKENLRKSHRFVGEVNKSKYFRCTCDGCNKNRGYLSKSRYKSKPLCVKCSTNTKKHKDILRQNHWSKQGISSSSWMTKDLTSPLRIKIGTNLRCRLNKAIKGNFKSGSAVEDLGCSIDEFKAYIESKFKLGMCWENWGRKGWHIDHIIPLSAFDLTNYEQFKKACHYSNLQPLWAKENLSKSDKVS